MQRSFDLIEEVSPQALVDWSNVHAILKAAITDGVLCALLLKTDGSLLASAQAPASQIPPKVIGGLAVSVWRSYDLVDAEEDDYLMEDERQQQLQHQLLLQQQQQQMMGLDAQDLGDFARASNGMLQPLDQLDGGVDDFPSAGDAGQDHLPAGDSSVSGVGDSGSVSANMGPAQAGADLDDLDAGIGGVGGVGGPAGVAMAEANADGFDDADGGYGPESQLRELLVECDRGDLALLLISRFVLCLYADGNGLSLGGLRYRLRAVAHQLRALGELYPE